MKRKSFQSGRALSAATILIALIVPCSAVFGQTTLRAGNLEIDIDAKGFLTALRDRNGGKDYLNSALPSPLMTVAAGGEILRPTAMVHDEADHLLVLTYGDSGVRAAIEAVARPTHLSLELKKLDGPELKAIAWGPFPTAIGETIGEIVGVVRNADFAIGLQALNMKTLAGHPHEIAGMGYGGRDHAAEKVEGGSVLQAFTLNRRRDRVDEVWGVQDVPVPAFEDEDADIEGSKIALFGCSASRALETIGKIEIAEGLPHPMLDGVWTKLSPTATTSYMIVPFAEDNLDAYLDFVEAAGMRYIYHDGPFETWGHFKLRPGPFPDGDASLKRCVERAGARGIRVGIHTLSNFTTTNDPYVSPEPDPRLMRIGSSRLSEDVDDQAAEIPIADPAVFRKRKFLSTAILDEELIQYGGVSESEPWRLIDCKRGAFGTRPSAHHAGASIGKLRDHPYKVFFPNIEMQDEEARRIGSLFAKTGLRQISFDGLEGCGASGEGEYSVNRFVQICYDAWAPLEVINDASRLNHYLWHIHTRMNWGEPWGRAMREGADYRFHNQDFFARNLFPRMLGWFQLRLASQSVAATSLGDMEWMLAKAAGFDAGFAISTNLGSLKGNGQTGAILAACREWETARHAGAFTRNQRERLRGTATEFHLEPEAEGRWRLYPIVYSESHEHRNEARQPGEPTDSQWEFENPYAEQPLRFTLKAVGGARDSALVNPTFEVGPRRVAFSVRIEAGQYLVCEDGHEGRVHDRNWKLLKTVVASSDPARIRAGKQTIGFNAEVEGEDAPAAQVVFKAIGEGEAVGN